MFAYTWVAVLPFLVHGVSAICGGYTYGIGNQIGLGNGISRCSFILVTVNHWDSFGC